MTANSLLKGKKILIVDDEPDVLETLEDLLFDCDTEKAASFEEAKRWMNSREFDLAILDIMGVAGFELLKIANEKKIVAVMLTAHALSPHNVVKAYKEGAAFYIPKEKMADITIFIEDILQARQKGKTTWEHWFARLGSYCESHFGPDWQEGDRTFWEKFPFY